MILYEILFYFNSTLETLFSNKFQGSLHPGWYKSLENICSRCKKSSLKHHTCGSAPHLWVNSNFLFHTKKKICGFNWDLPFNEIKYTLFELLVSVLHSITTLSSLSRAGWAPVIEIVIITCLFCFLCITESFGCLNWRHYINLRLLLLKNKGAKKSTKL